MQDLTIDTLKTLTNERFASVEKNLEAINSGNVAANMISICFNWCGSRKLYENRSTDRISGNASIFVDVSCLSSSATVDTLFLATIAAESIAISDDEPIIFDTAPINPGGHYNTVLGAYTAPFTGYYQRVFIINMIA